VNQNIQSGTDRERAQLNNLKLETIRLVESRNHSIEKYIFLDSKKLVPLYYLV
jgi:hypothetical protein